MIRTVPLLVRLPLQRLIVPVGASLLCAWLGWLGLDSRTWLQALDTPAGQASEAAPPMAKPLPALDIQAIAELFGARPPEPVETGRHAVPLTLLASLSEERAVLSRALILSPEGSAFYRLGDRLPGGARLKAVHPDHVLLQLAGREQRLSFPHANERFLTPRTSASP